MRRSDYLFGYDPRKRKPWQEYVPEDVAERVTSQPQGKRRAWLGRGNVRAAHLGRRAEIEDRQQAQQQAMAGQRAAMMYQNLPLEERKFMASQQQFQEGNRLKLFMQQQGFGQQEQMAGLQSQLGQADYMWKRPFEQQDIAGGQQHDIGMANLRGDIERNQYAERRPLEMKDWQKKFDYTQANQAYAPQYSSVQGPEGAISFVEKGPQTVLAPGSKLISPSQSITMEQKPAPAEERQSIIALQDLKRDLMEAARLYDPRYVGMADSRMGWIREKTGMGVSPDETSFRQLMSTMIDMAYIKSGKQISPQEMLMLKERMPDISISDPAFETRLNTFYQMLESMITSRTGALQQSGYITPGILPTQPGEDISQMSNEQLLQLLNQTRQ
jgi:hypothetical protein